MTDRRGSESGRRGSLSDVALVGLVVGAGATFVLGAVALGVGALIGRVSPILWLLLVLWLLCALGTVVCAVGLGTTLIGSRSRRPDAGHSEAEEER